MRVRVEYTVDVPDAYRRAINFHYERPGLASPAAVRDWLMLHGSALDDDLTYDLQQHEPEWFA
jgi:hypothetical protein